LFDELLSWFVLTDWRAEQQAERTQKADASCCKKGQGSKISTREKEKAKPFWQAVPGEESMEMIRTVYYHAMKHFFYTYKIPDSLGGYSFGLLVTSYVPTV